MHLFSYGPLLRHPNCILGNSEADDVVVADQEKIKKKKKLLVT
jgi:hypothetical protein